MKKILLAVGNKQYSEILHSCFSKHPQRFELADQEVLHFKFLLEIIDIEKPDILIFHDYHLQFDDSNERPENVWYDFITEIRLKYEENIRVVLLCERDDKDPFLSSLVSLGVKDIFNSRAIDLEELVEQLSDKPRFSRVSKYLEPGTSSFVIKEPKKESPNVENNKPHEEPKAAKKERPVVQKVVEKKVVQKVVEKKVIQKVVNKTHVKRDYKIHVHENVEKFIGIPVEKKIVMIGSPFKRVGSTFVSHLIAREIAKLGVAVNYIESPFASAYTYDRFIGHDRAPNYRSKYYEYCKDIEDKLPSDSNWEFQNVCLTAKHPSNERVYSSSEITFETMMKVLLSNQTTITLIDVGTAWEEEVFRDIYDIASNVFFVIEPDISNIQMLEESDELGCRFYRNALQNDQKTALIGNRFLEKDILSNELINDLFQGNFFPLPSFPIESVFSSQYNGQFINDHKPIEKEIKKQVLPIIEQLLPEQLLNKSKRKSTLFSGIFKKSISIEKTESLKEEITSPKLEDEKK